MGKSIERQELTLPKCNVIKTFMMLAVIAYHSMAFWQSSGWFNKHPAIPSVIFDFTATWLNTIHIYVFVFVSGYIFYYLRYEAKKYIVPRKDILKRAKRLLIPYVFISMCWVIPFQIYFFGFDATALLRQYMLGISPSQLWFLLMMFVVFVGFYFVSDIMIKLSFFPAILIYFVIYSISLVGAHIIPNIFQIWTACKYLLFYYLGFSMRKYGFRQLYKIPWICFFVLNIALFCSYYFIFKDASDTITKVMSMGWAILCQISGVAMVMVGFGGLHLDNIQNNRIYQFLNKYNFGMYLLHQQLIYISITLLNGHVANITLFIVNFLFAGVLSGLLSWVLSTWKITKKLMGM